MWLVEYPLTHPCYYDGTSEYACKNAIVSGPPDRSTATIPPPTCDWRIGRFCGNKLGPSEYEPKHCDGTRHVLVA